MKLDGFDLNLFEVDCDGSACGSHSGEIYIHPAQYGGQPLGRVAVRNGVILVDSLVPPGHEVVIR